MIIGRDMMVQIGLSDEFKHQVLQWDSASLPTKDTIRLLGQQYLIRRNMNEVVIKNSEPESKREANEIMVNLIDSRYAKADLEQVASNAVQKNSDERINLLSLLNVFEEIFYDTIGLWDTEPLVPI